MFSFNKFSQIYGFPNIYGILFICCCLLNICSGEVCQSVSAKYPTGLLSGTKLNLPKTIFSHDCFTYSLLNITNSLCVSVHNGYVDTVAGKCCYTVFSENRHCFSTCDVQSLGSCQSNVKSQRLDLQVIPQNCAENNTISPTVYLVLHENECNFTTVQNCTVPSKSQGQEYTASSISTISSRTENLPEAISTTTGTLHEISSSYFLITSYPVVPDLVPIASPAQKSEDIFVTSMEIRYASENLVSSYGQSSNNEDFVSTFAYTRTPDNTSSAHETSSVTSFYPSVTHTPDSTSIYPSVTHSIDAIETSINLCKNEICSTTASSSTVPSKSASNMSKSLSSVGILIAVTASVLFSEGSFSQDFPPAKQSPSLGEEKKPDSTVALAVSITVVVLIVGAMLFLIFRLVYKTRDKRDEDTFTPNLPGVVIGPAMETVEDVMNPCFIKIQGDFSESSTDDDRSPESERSSKAGKHRSGGDIDTDESTTFSRETGCFNGQKYTKNQQNVKTFGTIQNNHRDVYAVSYKHKHVTG